jgi:hypothetical protein
MRENPAGESENVGIRLQFDRCLRLEFRGDTAFASPDIYEYLKDNSIIYAIRLKARAQSGCRKHGTTVPRQRETGRSGGDMRRPGSEVAANDGQSCRKGRILVGYQRWRRHMGKDRPIQERTR